MEEFDRAREQKKKIFLYFKEGFKPTSSNDGKKFQEVLDLKDAIESKSEIRYEPFNESNFSGKFYRDLNKYISETYAHPGISNLTTNEEPQTNSLPNDYPKPSPLFTGRYEELKKFGDALKDFRIYVIEGIGGAGKTQFSAKCIDEFIKNTSNVIWYSGSSLSNFETFVETAGYGDLLKGKNKTDIELYNGLKALIEKDKKVIFLDNYNEYIDTRFLGFLNTVYGYLQNATIILITKTEPYIQNGQPLLTIKLQGLDSYAIEYARKLKIANEKYGAIDDAELIRICDGVQGHPLAIELSMWLMSYGKSADEILKEMPTMGLKQIEEFSKRLFFDILNHSSTTEEERNLFLKCSALQSRIAESEIKSLHEGENQLAVIIGLIDKLLITRKDSYYEIHPLIKSFAYEILPDKIPFNQEIADYYINQRLPILNSLLEEKIFHHLCEANNWKSIESYIEQLGDKFINQGHLGLTLKILDKLCSQDYLRPRFYIFYGDIAQIKSEWDSSIDYYDKSIECISDFAVMVEGIIKKGEIHFRRGEYIRALALFEEGLKISIAKDSSTNKARALNDIGLVYINFNALPKAYRNISAALKIRKEINDIEGIAASINNLGVVVLNEGRIPKALVYFRQSVRISEEIGDKRNIAVYLNNVCDALRIKGEINDAELENSRALNIVEELQDKELFAVLYCSLGAIRFVQGKYSDSLPYFLSSIEIAKEIGDKRVLGKSYKSLGEVYLAKNDYLNSCWYFILAFYVLDSILYKSEVERILTSLKYLQGKIESTKVDELFARLKDEVIVSIETDKNLKSTFEIVKIPIHVVSNIITKELGRNDKCPCGSQKKYKNCHGKAK